MNNTRKPRFVFLNYWWLVGSTSPQLQPFCVGCHSILVEAMMMACQDYVFSWKYEMGFLPFWV